MKTKITLITILFFMFFIISCKHKKNITEAKEVCFDTEILPIFLNNCANCHGNERTEKNIKYLDYSSIMGTIKTGNPDDSKAYEAITSNIGENVMPPDLPLSQNQRSLIRLWIEQGAKETKCAN